MLLEWATEVGLSGGVGSVIRRATVGSDVSSVTGLVSTTVEKSI